MDNPLSPEERQAALDNIPKSDLKKIQAIQGVTESSVKVDEEWLILAEFAKHFGWEAYRDARDDKVSAEEMMVLIAAARKLDHLALYNNARASFIGAGSASTKKPSDTFKLLTRDIITNVKADNE